MAVVLALVPAGGALAAQEQRDSVVSVERVDSAPAGERIVVHVAEGSPAERVAADLRAMLLEVGWDVEVRQARGPDEFIGMVSFEHGVMLDRSGLRYSRHFEIGPEEPELIVIAGAGDEETFEQLPERRGWYCELVGMSGDEGAAQFDARAVAVRWDDVRGETAPDDRPIVMVTQTGPRRFHVLVDESLDTVPCRVD